MVDIAALTALVYNRLKTDSQGAAVRALLGAGAQSVIHAHRIGDVRPPRPMLALRARAVVERPDRSNIATYTWWAYDNYDQGYWRLNTLMPAIASAYAAQRLRLTSGGAISAVELSDVGPETDDPALGLLLRTINLYVYL